MMQEFEIIWLFNLLIMRLPDESIYFQKRVMRTKLYRYLRFHYYYYLFIDYYYYYSC